MIHRRRTRFQPAKLLALLPLLASVACNARYSAAAFHLPGDSDAERGRAAFVELGCHACHQVTGASLPKSDRGPVVLGGVVDRKMTDAYVVAHLLDPSSRVKSARAQVTNAGQARMPGYADRMTVRQLTDIVAFLQSHYQLRPMPPQIWYQ